MPSTWKLIIEDDAGKQIIVPFTRDMITIGRKEGNTIRLTERNVSRNHAKLSRENGHVLLEDMKSFNGIKLNGDRIDGRVQVHEGDTIQIGDYHLALHAQDGAGQGAHNGAGQEPTVDAHRHRTDALPPQPDDDEFAGDTQRWEPPPGQPALQVGGMPSAFATVEDRAISDEHTAPAPIVTARTVEGVPPPPLSITSLASPLSQGGFGADSGDTERVTMDMLAPLQGKSQPPFDRDPSRDPRQLPPDVRPPPPSLPTRKLDVDLEPTVRQPSSPPPVSMPPSSPSQLTVGQEFFGETKPEARADRTGQPAVMPSPHATSSLAPAKSEPHPRAEQKLDPGPQAPPRTPAFEARALLEEQTEAMRAAPSGPDELAIPRLVVLNTIFSGSTFSLRAAEAVIGRTEDNDITIEHKSVSRNHAKVVREGDRVRILDLKSANGVLVNNEEVEAAVLRSGDVVELGRVKLRFVPIGERFSVAPDEIERARLADAAGDDFESDAGTGVTNPVRKKQAGTLSPPSSNYPIERRQRSVPLVWVAIVGVALLAIIAIIVVVLKPSSEEKKGDATTPSGTGTGVAIARVDVPPPGEEKPSPTPTAAVVD
ncbi:MAG TPA: FHA domain-containing protein, partial [Myxococcota bacterium]